MSFGAGGLSGAIPEELGNLGKLENLYLINTYLTGEIPPELGNLANLRDLRLISNPWRSSLTTNALTGEIPAELGNLGKLEVLWIEKQRLTGGIPAELGNLGKLKVLQIERNPLLGGEIPAELSNLSNLTNLRLKVNNLTGEIPPELGDLANLTNLDLYGNFLTGEIPSELGNLAKLEDLRLGDNNLTGCIPRSLRSTLRLSWQRQRSGVNLHFCAATTTPSPTPTPTATPATTPAEQCSGGTAVPNPNRNAGLLADCVALLTAKPMLEGDTRSPLNWSANRAISDWYGVTTANNRVTRLSLDGYDDEVSLRGEIPAQLGNLSNLTYLDLAFNNLTGEIPAKLGNLANLAHLDLHDNSLTGAVPAELGNLAKLERLNLYGNNLMGCVPQSLRAAASASAREQASGFTLPFCAAATTPTPTATSAPRPPRPTITPTPTTAPRDTPVASPTPTATPAIVIENTPTPTATPVQGETPVATPTPTATPAIVIETTPSPTPTATPTSVVAATDDPCVERLAGNGSATGSWAAGCLTANPPNAYDYYARFYTFTLDAASDVTITLSSDATAPYLYLLDGAGTAGAINRETGAANASAATITETLQPGSYTIEATTYYAATAGDFALEFAATPAPTATCAETLTGNASVNGAWTSACLSANPPNARDYYARFYTFTLDAASEVTITLSSDATAPYLYLLDSAGTAGAIKRETGVANASSATITETLQPGSYTIEATTYYSETTGDFTLELEIAR